MLSMAAPAFLFKVKFPKQHERGSTPMPPAVIAMVAILAGFALYVMVAIRLYNRLRTTILRLETLAS